MNYRNYETKNRSNGSIQISKIRDPKDKASYYWALSEDGANWKIIQDKRLQYNISGDEKQIIDMLCKLNKPITPASVKPKHISFKKYAEELVVTRAGRDVIFVGCSAGKTKPNAKVYTFPEEKENLAYVLDLENRTDILVPMPQDTFINISYFENEMKIIDDMGIVKIIKGKKIHVYEKNNEIYIKIGLTEKEKKKQAKKQASIDTGVWRAE